MTTSEDAESAEGVTEGRPRCYERLGEEERFDLVLASDVVYSMQHAEQLAVVVAGRLTRPGGRLAAMVPVRSEEHTRCFLRGLLACGLRVLSARVDREWVEGVTTTQRGAELIAADWMACTARDGRPFWHNARTNASVWIDPIRAAAWRDAASTFVPDAPLTEGDILFVDAIATDVDGGCDTPDGEDMRGAGMVAR